jgi:hypothetical protein
MMKAKTFLQSLLLLPYLVWVAAAVFSMVLIWPLLYTIGIPIAFLAEDIPILGKIFGALYGFIIAYVFGVVFWGLPYTLFAAVFFLWSKNKSTEKTYSALLYSPLVLALISAVGIMIVALAFRFMSGKFPPLEDWRNLGLISLSGAALCLIYGYLFVGVGAVGYRLCIRRKLLKNETEIISASTVKASPLDDKIENDAN